MTSNIEPSVHGDSDASTNSDLDSEQDSEFESDSETSDVEELEESENEFDASNCHGCGGTYGIYTTVPLSTFEETGRLGCSACDLIFDILEQYAADRDENTEISVERASGVVRLQIGPDKPKDLEAINISVYGHNDPNPIWLAKMAWEGRDGKVASAMSLPDIIGDTGSDTAMALAKKWIEKCEHDHPKCRQENPSLLPRRVLDLGGSSADSKIRLYETSNEPARYICLSHSWGKAELLKTTKGTLEARKQGIEFSELPETFKDAITVTRALGVRYLWIDSFCIVQDDEADWRRESSRMQTIYRDGYLTIAASKCTDSQGGLLSKADPNSMLTSCYCESQNEVIRTRQTIHHFDSSSKFPLLRRGWVFQERILSRRVLHFAAEELIWECMEDQRCECGFFEGSLKEDEGLGEKNIYRPVNEKNIFGWLHYVWWKTVKDYSRMDLTFDKDIFPALSGVARAHREARGSRYLAGLWEESLIYDLLWHVPQHLIAPGTDYRFTLQPRPQAWRAPTWSWASIKSAVHYNLYAGFVSSMTMEEVEVSPLGSDETGQLEDAHLIVSGEVTLVTTRGLPRDSSGNSSVKLLDENEEEIPSLFFYEDYDLSAPSDHQVADGDVLRLLLLGKMCDIQSSGGDPKDQIWFMVLRQHGDDEGELERIGMATMDVNDEEEPPSFLDYFVHEDWITIF